LVLYGHSLGGAAALHLVDQLGRQGHAGGTATAGEGDATGRGGVCGMIVENPMPSVPTMVRALYSHKWLPYHYLGPLAFDRWDSVAAMRAPGKRAPRPPSLWLRSGADEIIEEAGVREMYGEYRRGRAESEEGDAQVDREAAGVEAAADRWVECPGALHDTAYLDRRWRGEIRAFVSRVAEG